MVIFPAVDVKDGQCVRLRQGRMDAVDVYGDDPVSAAQRWIDEGATWLHLVDLDGAVKGAPVNHESIATILDRVQVKVQVGGGIRSLEHVEWYLQRGAERVVLGTSAISRPDVLREVAARFPGQIAVSLDVKAGQLYTDGWTRASGRSVREVAQELASAGVSQLILTDINQDGMLRGLDGAWLREQVAELPLPVIIAGGVTSLDDLLLLRDIPGVNGAIIGKALYTNAIELTAALDAVAG